MADFLARKELYRRTLAPLGDGICLELKDAVGFGTQQDAMDDPGGYFWLSWAQPHVPRTHVAFRATGQGRVDTFFSEALAGRGDGQWPAGAPTQISPQVLRSLRANGSTLALRSSYQAPSSGEKLPATSPGKAGEVIERSAGLENRHYRVFIGLNR